MSHLIGRAAKGLKFETTRSVSALVLGLSGVLVSGTGLAQAQEDVVAVDDAAPEAEETKTLGVVSVTGSNIRRKQDFSSPSPVQTVDETVIKNTGAVRVQDLFKGLTVNSGSQIANRQNALQGVSQFSLRGLGIGSTLTLVNGRRAGLSPVTDATGQLFTDSNAFPVNMIERIEVLTDGASATYGSEAVAGVVNIITRRNFDGFEITGEARTSTHDSFQLGGAFGQTFDRGSFSAFVNYYTQDGNFRGDIDIISDADAINTSDPDFNFGGVFNSGTGSPGRFDLAIDPDGDGVFERSGNTLADPDCVAAGGILRGSACRYDFIDQRRIIAEEDRFQAFTQFDYELTDRLSFNSEFSNSRNEIRDAIGGAVLRRTTNDGGFLVGADHPFNYFTSDGEGGITYAGPNGFAADPTLQAVPVIFRGRPLGSAFDGDNADDIETVFSNLRFSAGIDYELNESWNVSANYTISNNEYDRAQPRDYDTEDFQAALDSGAWNPFGTAIVSPDLVGRDGVSTAGNSEQDLLLFSNTITDVGSVSQEVMELTLSGETGLVLAGGPVAVAIGSQYRELAFENTPDGRRQSGDNGRNEVEAAIPLTKQDVYAVYAEALLPITDQLEAQLALRFEDYGDAGGDTIDPKVALKYDVTDNLALRGSWGTSFQAPSIRQVSGSVGSAGIVDPLLGAEGGTFNVTVFTSGSPDLTSQSAENLNLGAIWTSDNGLNISFDYWMYDYQDLILPGGDPQSIVDADPNGPAVLRDPSGQLNAIFTGFENRGNAEAQGFDINANYTPDWWNWGDMTFDASATIVTEFTSDEFEGLDGNGDLKGSRNFANAFGAVPDVKYNFGGTWREGPHTANISIRTIGEYVDDQSGDDIDSQTTVDMRYTLSLEEFFGTGTDLTIGAVNVFDEDPPRIESRPLFDTETHDPRGRQIYVGFRQAF